MSLPPRAPEFQSLYPDRATYDEVQARFDRSAAPPSLAVPHADQHALVEQWIQSGQLPSGLSIRAAARYLLGTATIESDYEGLITQLLLVVPKFDDVLKTGLAIDPKLGRHYRALLAHFGDRVQFLVVSTERQRAEFEGWLRPAQRQTALFVNAPIFRFTHWSQDPFVVLRAADDQNNRILLESVRFTRSEDMTIADEIALQQPSVASAVSAYLFFQGGNVLGGRSLTLVGQDHISRNAGRVGMSSDADVVAAMAQTFGTPVLALGGARSGADFALRTLGALTGAGRQPIFHIDMYITRTGVVDRATGKEVVFLGRPSEATRIVGRSSDLSYLDSPVIDSFFDETEAQLSAVFVVKHLPLYWTFGQINNARQREKYYVLTWNNALVENNGHVTRVLLPRYDDPGDCQDYGVDLVLREALQTVAEQAWRDLGFDVHVSDGVEDLAWGDGAIHCLVKVLRRT